MGIFKKVAAAVESVSQSKSSEPRYSYGEFVVVDVETTGLDPLEHRVVQLALVRVNNGMVTEIFESIFNPEGPVGKTEIHGITQKQVDIAPLFNEKIDEITEFIKNRTLVAHNARFDLAFMRSEFERAGLILPWFEPLCTLKASEYYLPGLPRRKLVDCCEAIGVQIENAHTATGDAIATAKLCHYYLMPEKKPLPRSSDLELISNPKQTPQTKSVKDQIYIKQRIQRSKDERTEFSDSTLMKLSHLIKSAGLQEVTLGLKINGAMEYLEKLVEFLEDSTLSPDELNQLDNLRNLYEINESDCALLHSELVILLIEIALEDEKISVTERDEFKEICQLLRLSESRVPDFTKVAKARRVKRLSANLLALPEDWKLGEPLRVGQNVVFTGCDPVQRERLEVESKKSGVFIASGVSKKTVMLVSDGGYSGNKAREAKELGVRVVHPDEYEVLLKYIQPAV